MRLLKGHNFAGAGLLLAGHALAGLPLIDAPANVTNFAQYAAFSNAAYASPSTDFDLIAATDREALKASVGRDSTAALKVPGVDALEAGMSYDVADRVVTISAGFTGILSNWHFANIRLDINTSIVGIEQCLFEDTIPLTSSDFGGNISNVIYLRPSANGSCGFINKVTYRRTRNMLQGRGMFINNRRPGPVPLRNSLIDGVSGDFMRPDYGVQMENVWAECRALDDAVEYDPSATYNTGDYVLNASRHLFVADVDGVTGAAQAPEPNKSSNAFWRLIDAHMDFMQMTRAEYAGLDPAAMFVRNCWFEFTDVPSGPSVKHIWYQLSGAGPEDPFFTVFFENCVFARPEGGVHEPVSIPGTNKSIAAPIFKGCWMTGTNSGEYAGITDASALWLNNRDYRTGEITALPTNTTDDTTLAFTVTGNGTTLTLRCDRTPIANAGGTITLRKGGADVEVLDIEDGVLVGESSLEFTLAQPLSGQNAIRITGGAIRDSAGYSSPAIEDDTTLPFVVGVGYHLAVIGQSENVIGWLDNSSFSTGNNLYPAVAAGVDMEIMIPAAANTNDTTHGIYSVTQAEADARNISPGAVAIGNLWHLGSGGEPLRLNGVCNSGTGMNDMMDDDLSARSFAVDKAQVDAAEAAWGPTRSVTPNWYVSESGASGNFWEARSAHFFGINDDGTDYDFVSGDLEHCLIDTTGRGYGMFADDVTVNVMYPGNGISGDAQSLLDPIWHNYEYEADGGLTFARIRQNGMPAYQERRDFLADAPAANRGVATVSPALAVMGDYTGGVQKPGQSQVSSHPALQSKYGQILYSQDVAFALLCSEGFATPTRLNRTEAEATGAYVDFIFDLPAGATLTTQRIVEALGPVASPRPHQQQVMGFVIWRDGDSEADSYPLWRSDNTDDTAYPPAYRGSAVIHDTGTDVTGGREGTVRVTLDQPLVNNDRVQFGPGGGYGAFIIHGHPDYDAQMALDGLRAYEARLDDATIYAYPGGPVVNQEEVILSGITPPPPPVGGQRVSKQTGDDAWLQGPAVGAGVVGMTALFEGRIDYQSGFGRKAIIALNSNGFRLEADTRSTQRTVRALMEDGNGGNLFTKIFAANSIAPLDTDDMTLMLTMTQDDGSGNALMALYLNGALVEAIETTPASASATFQAIQTFEVLNGNVGSTTARVAIWAAYSPDGTEPSSGLIVDHTGPATYWNGQAQPAGWSKQGADLFVDV